MTVHIVTLNDRAQTLEIGNESDDVFFAEDPVEITDEVNDTFDHLLRQSASIRLLCGNLITDFFSTSCRDAVVNVYKEGKCLFAGYIEPQTFSQPYNERWDELELNCVDALSALQYSKYKNVGTAGIEYSAVKAETEQRCFRDIVVDILGGVTENLDILGLGGSKFWYDGSKAIDAQTINEYSIFSQVAISDLLFFGDDESEIWQQDKVLEEVLRYFNLHIAQDGLDFFIYSWESVKSSQGSIVWQDIEGGATRTTECRTVVLTIDNVADCDTSISISEVYNQIMLTANIESIENLLVSPLDEESLTSPFTGKQKYLTEYSSDGEGKTAYNAFYNMTHDEKTTYGAGAITDWFVQVKRHDMWTFPMKGDTGTDLIDYFGSKGTSQHALPDWMGTNPGAAIMSVGSVKVNTANDDNSPTSKVNMTDCLVVSVNGNGKDNDESGTYPNTESIQACIPYAVYNGSSAAGVFSPSDSRITNYIVLSGKIILNPIMAQTYRYTGLHNRDWDLIGVWHNTVPSRNNGDGRYYTRQYWQAEKPSDEVTWHEGSDMGWYPYTGEGPEEYEFQYSAIGDSSDTISKVSVLACMLVIGDKCVVETGTDGQTTDFVWQTYKSRSECQSDDEYYQQSFTIGFDPKKGDKLVGTEFDLQNNIDYTMGIDAEGIAIPIGKLDKVSGRVQFMILGPVNVTWDLITRRHPTFFRHTKWSSTTVPLLAHVSSIIVKSFEIKVYSDSGLVSDGNDDNDLVYVSDTTESFVNKKDDLEFKINSALTLDECKQLGVSDTVKMSTPLNMSTGYGLLTVYDRNSKLSAKPERIYVDSYYNECHKPRIIMEQKVKDSEDVANRFNHYYHKALGKEFFVQGIGRNLIEDCASLTLKEIGT